MKFMSFFRRFFQQLSSPSEVSLSIMSDSVFFAASRKRSKRERDKAWETEEKSEPPREQRERRGSGEHRRSRQKDRTPEESEEESPPPSISDGEYSEAVLTEAAGCTSK